jgi:hypothetical protein
MPIDAANILLDLGRENPGFEAQPKAFSGSLLSQDDITGTGAIDSNNLDAVTTNDHLDDPMDELPDNPYAGLFNSGEPLRSVGVERIRKGQTSKASVMLEVLQKLKLKKVTATDLLELVASGSQQGITYFHSAFYGTTHRARIHQLLDTIWAHPKGKSLLEDWMRPHAIDLVCETVHREMEAAKPFLKMGVNEVTPEFVSNWDIRETMEPIAINTTPMLSRVLHAATQPKLPSDNSESEEDYKNRRTVCSRSLSLSEQPSKS